MGVLGTSRLSPPTVTQRRRKSSALSIHGAASVVDEAKPLPSGEERETVQHALVGDSNALTTLFARDRAKLYRTAFSLLRNKEDAEDALQDGLLSAYVNLRSFEGRSRFSTWLTRVVLNAALMNRRRLPALAQISLDEIVGNDAQPWPAWAVDARPDPEQAYALVETREWVEKKMSQLSPDLRLAFQLRDMENLSNLEAAKAASVGISAIKSRTLRARRQLASLLTARGVSASRFLA